MAATKTFEADCVVVGGGPAGILALKERLEKTPDHHNYVLLEAAPNLGGRSKSAFHLVDSQRAEHFPILVGAFFNPVRVRWERSWVDFDSVDWAHKDWIAQLPQWALLKEGLQALLLEGPSFEKESEGQDSLTIKLATPVSLVEQDAAQKTWKISTPDGTWKTQELIWAAGVKSFQNAFGKQETQDFLVENKRYNQDAADFRGGVALELVLKDEIQWAQGFEHESIFGLPVRFEGKLYLMMGAIIVEGEGADRRTMIRTLTHVHQELLTDPKLMMSFQKSLRRGLKMIFDEKYEGKGLESWVVSDRVLGHMLGTPWVLKTQDLPAGLNFVGDETESAMNFKSLETLSALASAESV